MKEKNTEPKTNVPLQKAENSNSPYSGANWEE